MQSVHHRHWPRGLPHEMRVPQVPLTHYLETAASRYPDKPAIVYAGAGLSYARLLARAEALAGFLRERLGVRAGDRILLMSQNCPQFVAAFYGVLRAGAVVVPVNAMTTSAELRHYVEDSGARIAIAAQELLPRLLPNLAPQAPNGIEAVLVHAYRDAFETAPENEALPELVLAPRQPLDDPRFFALEEALALRLPAPADEPKADDLCVLPYTSGTTGHPKGCMHTHATVQASALASKLWRGLHAESVFMGVAPMFHMLGMQNAMNLPILVGGTVVMMPRWHAATAARLIERHRVSVWAAPPAMLIDFFADPETGRCNLSSLAMLSGGGAAMPEAVAAMLQQRFGIVYQEGYGMTETASFLHANPPARCKRQCLGVPTLGVDSRIVDPVTLEALPAGEVGELVTHGPQLMLGYWRNEAANRSAFVEIDGKRYLRTGDLASVDEDGYFFMRDRLKRMINASGFKIWPAEVESALYEHPAVHEVCVVGVPDAKRGESVKALVVLKPGYRGSTGEQDIIDWSRERMAVYKAPRFVTFLDELPKSTTGKILWRQLQEAERSGC